MEAIRKMDRHRRLMNGMAATVGADPELARMRGRFDEAEAEAALRRCLSCGGSADCPGWLADHQAGAEKPPAYCRNADLFAALQP